MAKSFEGGGSGYTGGVLEWELFGDVNKMKVEEAVEEMNLTYDRSIELAKKIQKQEGGSSPSDPKNKFANDLHATLAEKLDLEDMEDLNFYSALKTPLDIKHGIDSFFEINYEVEKDDKKEEKSALVTLDVTMRGELSKNQKANVIIRMQGGAPDPDEADYEQKLEQIAEAIKKAFENIKNGNKFFKTDVTV